MNLHKLPLIAALALPGLAFAADPPPPRESGADLAQQRRDLEQMREQMREMSRKMAQMQAKLGDVGPRTYAYRYLGDPDSGMVGIIFDRDKQ